MNYRSIIETQSAVKGRTILYAVEHARCLLSIPHFFSRAEVAYNLMTSPSLRSFNQTPRIAGFSCDRVFDLIAFDHRGTAQQSQPSNSWGTSLPCGIVPSEQYDSFSLEMARGIGVYDTPSFASSNLESLSALLQHYFLGSEASPPADDFLRKLIDYKYNNRLRKREALEEHMKQSRGSARYYEAGEQEFASERQSLNDKWKEMLDNPQKFAKDGIMNTYLLGGFEGVEDWWMDFHGLTWSQVAEAVVRRRELKECSSSPSFWYEVGQELPLEEFMPPRSRDLDRDDVRNQPQPDEWTRYRK